MNDRLNERSGGQPHPIDRIVQESARGARSALPQDGLSDVPRPEPDLAVRGLLLDLDKFAVHDGPGIRTAVYLKGCPLHCAWCHSPESQGAHPELLYLARKCTGSGACVEACPVGAVRLVDVPAGDGRDSAPRRRAVIDWTRCTHCGRCVETCYSGALKMAGEWTTVGDLVAEVEKDVPFFTASGGGVTLTGGEVALQPEFSYHFLAACKARGISTALETSGLGPWRTFHALSRVTDLFLYDLKLMDDEEHRRFTGVSNRRILENLRQLASLAEIVVRVPCIPGVNDSQANVAATAEFAREAGVKSIHLLPYNSAAGAKYLWTGRAYGLSGLTTQSAEQMEALAEVCRLRGLATQVGG